MKAIHFSLFVLASAAGLTHCRSSSQSSNELTSLADAVALTAPQKLVHVENRDGSIDVSWSPVAGATSYTAGVLVGDTTPSSSERSVERLMRPLYIIKRPQAGETYRITVRAVGRAGLSPRSATLKFKAAADGVGRVSKNQVFLAEMNVSDNGETVAFVERKCESGKSCVQIVYFDKIGQRWRKTTLLTQAITATPYLASRMNADGTVVYVTAADGVLRFTRDAQDEWQSKKVAPLTDISALALVANNPKLYYVVRDNDLYAVTAAQDDVWGTPVKIGRGGSIVAAADGATLIAERSGIRAWTLNSGSWSEQLIGTAVNAAMSESGTAVVGFDTADALVSYQLSKDGSEWQGGAIKKVDCCYRYIALSADGTYLASGNTLLKRSGASWSEVRKLAPAIDAAEFVGNTANLFVVSNSTILYLADGAADFVQIY